MNFEDFFSRIENHYAHKRPFVVYRKPNTDAVKAMLQKTNALYATQDFTEQGFVFSPFNATEDSVLIPVQHSESISISHAMSSTLTSEGINSAKRFLIKSQVSQAPKKHHISLVEKGVEAIKNNQFKKVVLSRQDIVDDVETHPISIFKKLLSSYSSAFVYCWYHPKIGLWLGATPETLIKIEGKQFSIMALAGTQDYKNTLDVVWQEKEQQEQQFVTDFIIDSLKDTLENLKVSETETVKAGNLLHLKTMISARLKSNSSLKQIISTLHPTPAVCGLPKAASKQFILKYENYNREFYTGYLGELNLETVAAPRSGKLNIENRAYAFNKKSTQLYVNLRCMQLKNSKAMIYVGGGVTESSNPESEWDETVSKSLVIKSIL